MVPVKVSGNGLLGTANGRWPAINVTPSGMIAWANDTFARSIGRDAIDLQGRSLFDFVRPNDFDTANGLLRQPNATPIELRFFLTMALIAAVKQETAPASEKADPIPGRSMCAARGVLRRFWPFAVRLSSSTNATLVLLPSQVSNVATCALQETPVLDHWQGGGYAIRWYCL
jgi:hypothetical protein